MVNENCVLLTGASRSGTTLVCHLLNQVPNTVALHEPMLPGKLRKSQHPEGPAGDIMASWQIGKFIDILLRRSPVRGKLFQMDSRARIWKAKLSDQLSWSPSSA